MPLAVIRHAESVENADKYSGFYRQRRPYDGRAAYEISRQVVGLTVRGFKQAVWLQTQVRDLVGPGLLVYTSGYRRAKDTAAIAFDGLPGVCPQELELLDEQHYGEATYMSKEELYATFPNDADTRRLRKHLWLPPGGESLAGGVTDRATAFLNMITPQLRAGWPVVAITHHTMIIALRAQLEGIELTDVVAQTRRDKPINATIRRYDWEEHGFILTATVSPPW